VVDVLDKVMEFPQMGSGPNRKQIIDALRNTAQSASNNIAETASMPVDAIAWALRKAGVPIGDKPMMGSDWMREKGLTAPVQEGASKVVGDTIGMISPMGLSKQGAKAMIDAGSKLKGLPVGMSIKDVSDLEAIYHGTSPQAAKAIEKSGFDLGKSADGTMWFTSNPQIGEVAASNKGAIIQRKLPKDMKLGSWDEMDKYSTDELLNLGYHGLRLPDEGVTTYQIFNPEKLVK
jgi:hypothetical protein